MPYFEDKIRMARFEETPSGHRDAIIGIYEDEAIEIAKEADRFVNKTCKWLLIGNFYHPFCSPRYHYEKNGMIIDFVYCPYCSGKIVL